MKMIALTLLTASLSLGQKITVEFDGAAHFSNYHTFALRDGQLNSRNPALNSELVKKRIDDAIVHYLSAKGLTIVAGHADLNVRYHFGSAPKTELDAYPAGWRGFGTRVVRVPYTEGTLVIDLRDPASRSLVWRAIAHEDKRDPDKIAGKLEEMIRKSIAKYPPKADKVY
jgi:uncharacterized protein DUF4136